MNSLNFKSQLLEVGSNRNLCLFFFRRRSLASLPCVRYQNSTNSCDMPRRDWKFCLRKQERDGGNHCLLSFLCFFCLLCFKFLTTTVNVLFVAAAFLTQTVQLDDATVKFEIWVRDVSCVHSSPCSGTRRCVLIQLPISFSTL